MTGDQRNIGAELCERLACIGENLTLTDAEREAINWCIFQDWVPQEKAATLRGLLDRTKDGGK
jgi:hypothetical protein